VVKYLNMGSPVTLGGVARGVVGLSLSGGLTFSGSLPFIFISGRVIGGLITGLPMGDAGR
jgi:hypothetical protein